MIKKLYGLIPKKVKLDSIVESVTTNAKQKKIAKLFVRIIQIGVATYLLKEGLIEQDDAITIIQGE